MANCFVMYIINTAWRIKITRKPAFGARYFINTSYGLTLFTEINIVYSNTAKGYRE